MVLHIRAHWSMGRGSTAAQLAYHFWASLHTIARIVKNEVGTRLTNQVILSAGVQILINQDSGVGRLIEVGVQPQLPSIYGTPSAWTH